MERDRVVKSLERDGLDAAPVSAGSVEFKEDELYTIHRLNGTWADRAMQWNYMRHSMDFQKSVWLIGCGAVGTVLLHCLMWVMKPSVTFRVIDKRRERGEAVDDVVQKTPGGHRVEFVCQEIVEGNVRAVMERLGEGDLVVDCSVSVDTKTLIELCFARGALFINSAIEDWMKDGFYVPDNDMEETMHYMHSQLESIRSKRSSALVSMGCNPGSVSVWLKAGLEFLSARFGFEGDYADIAMAAKVQTVHVSECDTQRCAKPRPAGEYWNTWSSDSTAFYKEGVGPSETGWGTHESKQFGAGDFVKGGADVEGFRVWRADGFCMEVETVLPLAGRVRGMVVRHDESFTLARFLSVERGGKRVYGPSVYYVYRPCEAAQASVEELRKVRRPPDSYMLMAGCVEEGRDEVGLSLFCEGGAGLWVGSELDVEEARKLFAHRMDRWTNATINQVAGGYLAGIAWLLENRRAGIMEPEAVPSAFAFRWASPLWGPVVAMPFRSPFASNRIEDMGLARGDCMAKERRQ